MSEAPLSVDELQGTPMTRPMVAKEKNERTEKRSRQ